MKTKKIRLRIETQKDFSKRIGRNMQKIDRGIKKKLTEETLSVESISDLQKILTIRRIEILSKIRELKPNSIYELAKLVGRKQENVQADVKFLANLGLIDIKKNREGRIRSRPIVDYDSLNFNVPLSAL